MLSLWRMHFVKVTVFSHTANFTKPLLSELCCKIQVDFFWLLLLLVKNIYARASVSIHFGHFFWQTVLGFSILVIVLTLTDQKLKKEEAILGYKWHME